MIRNFTHKITLSLLLCLSCFYNAQSSGLGVGVTLISYTFENTSIADLGYTITITAQVTNFDSTPFTDSINFGLHDLTQNLSNTSIFGKPRYSGNIISLDGHESVPALFSVHVDPVYFSPGPDVIVVWPLCTWPISDSIVIPLNIQAPNSVSNESEEAFSYTVLSDRILLKNLSTATNFKQVRIYNLIGQQVYEHSSVVNSEVPLPNLPKGLYLCELVTTNNAKRTIRFVH